MLVFVVYWCFNCLYCTSIALRRIKSFNFCSLSEEQRLSIRSSEHVTVGDSVGVLFSMANCVSGGAVLHVNDEKTDEQTLSPCDSAPVCHVLHCYAKPIDLVFVLSPLCRPPARRRLPVAAWHWVTAESWENGAQQQHCVAWISPDTYRTCRTFILARRFLCFSSVFLCFSFRRTIK